MLFKKDIEPRCAYCRRGAVLDEERVMCMKRGVTSAADSCSRFKYDPLKRIPPKPISADFSHLKEEDFSL